MLPVPPGNFSPCAIRLSTYNLISSFAHTLITPWQTYGIQNHIVPLLLPTCWAAGPKNQYHMAIAPLWGNTLVAKNVRVIFCPVGPTPATSLQPIRRTLRKHQQHPYNTMVHHGTPTVCKIVMFH